MLSSNSGTGGDSLRRGGPQGDGGASIATAEAPEGTSLLCDASASFDPDGYPLQFRWDFESDGTWDTPYTVDPTISHTWGDDFVGVVTVEVSDGTETATATATVNVANAAPVVLPLGVTVVGQATATLRVAGEKFHDVTATLTCGGNVTATATIVRVPGNPNEKVVSLGTVSPTLGRCDAEVVYTPLDDPVNGQVWGALPAWLILTQDGNETRLHHTFNVRHADTWVWTVEDLGQYLAPSAVALRFTATDPGSDDLAVTIDWGDGTADNFFFPNNASVVPDPDPSVEVNPRTVDVTANHVYAASGKYTVVVTVTDDDGGITASTTSVSA